MTNKFEVSDPKGNQLISPIGKITKGVAPYLTYWAGKEHGFVDDPSHPAVFKGLLVDEYRSLRETGVVGLFSAKVPEVTPVRFKQFGSLFAVFNRVTEKWHWAKWEINIKDVRICTTNNRYDIEVSGVGSGDLNEELKLRISGNYIAFARFVDITNGHEQEVEEFSIDDDNGIFKHLFAGDEIIPEPFKAFHLS